MPNTDLSSTGTIRPDWTMTCRRPTAFIRMDFPPAFGPLRRSSRFGECNARSKGMVSLPSRAFFR